MNAARDGFVGIVEKKGRFLTAVPFFAATGGGGGGGGGGRQGGRSRATGVAIDRHRDATVGSLVLVSPPNRSHAPGERAKVLRVLGRPDNTRALIEALMLDRGLYRRFPAVVENAAKDARDGGGAEHERRDLRDLATFTIDPATARDFDDAISASGSRVWVHIADVAAFVAPGSPVDREAHRRGTSTYVPGAVEPMLPEALSNDACSLRPGVDRLAVTVEMQFDGPRVEKASFYRSVIRSDERLDYDRVDRVFAGDEPAREPWAQPLADARAVSQTLQAAREARGALAVETSEPEFSFDGRGHVIGATASVQTESHRLIEHLMISANEQVAGFLETRGVPTLYRVHERPEPARAERLVAQLASLGISTPPVPESMSRTQAADVVADCALRVDAHVRRTGHGRAGLTSLVLRSLKQAYYGPKNLGHAGLGSPRYCHFTSPIRRYPDLVCHRALLSAVGGGEDGPHRTGMETLGEWTSGRERDAMSVERAADDIVRCSLLERALFDAGWETEWEGEVVGVIGAGAFVAFGDGYEGLMPVRRMRGGWWELNEEGTILHAAESGATVRLGDPVRVRVDRVDIPRGRVDLVPAVPVA